eukprot:TRINITY_DN765_c0_g1_i4.p1 TRINITY_DN765_c0_g1~~TRINITY_DN765_c0_g1_i4.p1  ORF type:complete len:110 (-),score=4.37 TRINITY_DN765_c0_g1_i4:92-421(-)
MSFSKIFSQIKNTVSLNVTVNSLTSVNVAGAVFGTPVGPCNKEAVAYNPNNQSIVLTNIDNPNDCLNILLNSYDVSPDSILISYVPSTDTVIIHATSFGAVIPMKHCSS